MAQPHAVEKARSHYERGTAYYNLNFFVEAIKEFQEAYLAKPDPAILYNIAQAHRQAGNAVEALSFYKNYLRTAKDPPNRREVEKRIAELEKAVAPGAGAAAPPAPAPAAPAWPPPAPAAAGPAPDMNFEPPPSRAYFGSTQAPPPETQRVPVAPPPAAPQKPTRAELVGVDFSMPPEAPTVVATPAPAPPPPSPPLYTRWWFWTGIGAVVVGGLAAGYVLRPQDPKCPSDALGCR